MSGIEFPEYLRRIQNTLNDVVAAGQALTVQLQADHAAHRPVLPAREHKHTPDNIAVMLPPTLEQVIDEILKVQESTHVGTVD
jgi:hypothetical protein